MPKPHVPQADPPRLRAPVLQVGAAPAAGALGVDRTGSGGGNDMEAQEEGQVSTRSGAADLLRVAAWLEALCAGPARHQA